MSNGILEYIKNEITYLDGGMGTLLQGMGLAPGELPELWNLTHADRIVAVHKAYFDAGSNVVSANTFGANSLNWVKKSFARSFRPPLPMLEGPWSFPRESRKNSSLSTWAPRDGFFPLSATLILRRRSRSFPKR